MEKKYKDDIKHLMSKLEEEHPDVYFNIKKSKIEEIIKDFDENRNFINNYDFYYLIKIILKLVNDPHTVCTTGQKSFPLKLKIINNSIFIVKAIDKYSDYQYKEIISINNIPISDVIVELEKTISYSTSGHLTNQLEIDLLRPICLLSLPIFNNCSSEIIYKCVMNGDISELKFNASDVFVSDLSDKRSYWYNHLESKNVLVINYIKCLEDNEKPMKNFVDEISGIVDKQKIENIIIDLRGNSGGDSNVFKPLIEYLNNHHFNLVTLVDHGVFSSGRWAAIELKKMGSKFFGSEIGTQINAFGHISKLELPNTKMTIIHSTRYWYYNGDKMVGINKARFLDFFNDEKNKQHFLPSELTLDFYVENSIEDYMDGFDRVLNAAILEFDKAIHK